MLAKKVYEALIYFLLFVCFAFYVAQQSKSMALQHDSYPTQ